MERTADVIVVGAGIVGLSTAYELARRGARVMLLESRDVAAGTSGACDGNIMVQSKRPGLVLELAKASAALFPAMSHLSATSGTQPNRRSAPSSQNRKSPRKRGLKGSRFPEGSIVTELATPVKDRADSRAYRPRAAALGGAYPAIPGAARWKPVCRLGFDVGVMSPSSGRCQDAGRVDRAARLARP